MDSMHGDMGQNMNVFFLNKHIHTDFMSNGFICWQAMHVGLQHVFRKHICFANDISSHIVKETIKNKNNHYGFLIVNKINFNSMLILNKTGQEKHGK
jgi:hypothetical protein